MDDKENCKISDFGLSRETEENVYNVKTVCLCVSLCVCVCVCVCVCANESTLCMSVRGVLVY